MIPNSDSPQDYFRLILTTVVSGAYTAAGYLLDENPTQWAGGMFRYGKQLDSGDYAGMYTAIDYQHLHYSEGDFGRFRVTLARSDQASGKLSRHPHSVRRLLSALVVEDFGVQVLRSPDHWWEYRNVTEMGDALGEAGHLVIGFGLPWLSGDLMVE